MAPLPRNRGRRRGPPRRFRGSGIYRPPLDRRRFRGSAEPLDAGLQRLEHDRALLRRQPRVQQQRAVVRVVPADPALRAALLRATSPRDDAAVRAHEPLELRRRRVARQREQLLLRLHLLHARERAHLRVAEPALGEGLAGSAAAPPGAARHARARAPRQARSSSARRASARSCGSPSRTTRRGARTPRPGRATGTSRRGCGRPAAVISSASPSIVREHMFVWYVTRRTAIASGAHGAEVPRADRRAGRLPGALGRADRRRARPGPGRDGRAAGRGDADLARPGRADGAASCG